MSVLPVIEEAIKTRTPIAFEYVRPDKDPGVRRGNPHAAFIRRLKNGEDREYLDLWQTDGVTDSGEPLPGWRKFFLNDIRDPQLLPDRAPFETAEGYNPVSYEFPIVKI